MATFKTPHFFVPCNCFDLVAQTEAKKALNLVGLRKLVISPTESRLATVAVSPIVDSKGFAKQELVIFAFCPWCGAKLIVEEIESEDK